MDSGATSWESGTTGREDRDETRLGVEIGMLPYVVGREVTAILEAAQAAADQITARAREEAESAAERVTASARERARAVQERIARFERELAELMADGGESTESADGAAPVSTSHPGSSPALQPESGTERIVVEYRSEAETPSAEESGRGDDVIAVAHDVVGGPAVEGDDEASPAVEGEDEASPAVEADEEESPAVRLLRQLVR